MPPHGRDEAPEWIWVLLTASRRLALGSLLLLIASPLGAWIFGLDLLAYGLGLAFIGLTAIGVVFHLLGWVVLQDGAWRSNAMIGTFLFSVVGALAGLIFVLVTRPVSAVNLLFGVWLLIPYMPEVWGPVAIGHAATYFLAARRLRALDLSNPMTWGGGFLLALAFAGFATRGVVWPGPWDSGWAFGVGMVLAGLTCVGYGLIALGLGELYESRRTALDVHLVRALPESLVGKRPL